MCKLSTFDKFSAIVVLLGSLTWDLISLIFRCNIITFNTDK